MSSDVILTGADIQVSKIDNTKIDAALSNKVNCLNSYTAGDIKQIPKVPGVCFISSAVTGMPRDGLSWLTRVDSDGYSRAILAYDGTQQWLRYATDDLWTDWVKIATATLSNGYNLPLTDGISVQAGLSAVYSKDQFGQVIVLGSLSGQMPNGAVVATLPSGFHPIYTFEIPATCDFDTGRIQVNSLGEIRVRSKLSECSSLSFLAVFVAEK